MDSENLLYPTPNLLHLLGQHRDLGVGRKGRPATDCTLASAESRRRYWLVGREGGGGGNVDNVGNNLTMPPTSSSCGTSDK